MVYTKENLELALSLAAQGLFIFPCQGVGDRRKQPCYGIISWTKQSTTDPGIIREWWRRWPDAVPAIDQGRSGTITFDLDRGEKVSGADWLRARVGEVDAPGCDTPSGGRHLTYLNRKDKPFGNGRGKLPPKSEAPIDVRGVGGYTIAAGSRFKDGGWYAPRGDLRDIQPLPDWAIELLTAPAPQASTENAGPVAEPITEAGKAAYGQKALARMVRDISGLAADCRERNETLNKEAFRCAAFIRDGYLTHAEVHSALTLAALACGLERRETAATLASALGAGAAKADPVRPKPRQGEDGGGPLPFDPAELVANVVARGGKAEGEEEDGSRETPPPSPPPGSGLATPYVRRDPSTIPRRQWLYGTHLIRQFCSATIAHGAVGKSNLFIIDALAMVTGRNLRGIQPPGRLKVWFWNGEDPMVELERRIEAACKYYGIPVDETNGRLFVDSGRRNESKIVIAETTRPGVSLPQPQTIEAVLRAIHDNKIDVVLIDPFISSHKVSENDNNAIDAVVKTWGEIAEITGIGLDLAHHSKKTGGEEVTVEDSRGASALLAAVRSARALNTMTVEEANKSGVPQGLRGRYFRVTNGKLNLAPPPEQDDWCHTVSVSLGNGVLFDVCGQPVDLDGDSVGVVTQWQWPDVMDGMTEDDFAKAAAGIQDGKWLKAPQAKEKWVGHTIARALGLDLAKAKDRAKVNGVLKTWLAEGKLVEVERLDANSIKRTFIEVGGMQPKEGCAAEVTEEENEEEGGGQ
jgi:hypothetical protein